MIKKTFAIMAFLLTITTLSWADGEKQWHVVADNNQAVPVSNVAYLVAADDGKFLNIVLNDETVIANVSNITFEERNTTAIALPDNRRTTLAPYHRSHPIHRRPAARHLPHQSKQDHYQTPEKIVNSYLMKYDRQFTIRERTDEAGCQRKS